MVTNEERKVILNRSATKLVQFLQSQGLEIEGIALKFSPDSTFIDPHGIEKIIDRIIENGSMAGILSKSKKGETK